jgi:hypothetical protein
MQKSVQLMFLTERMVHDGISGCTCFGSVNLLQKKVDSDDEQSIRKKRSELHVSPQTWYVHGQR